MFTAARKPDMVAEILYGSAPHTIENTIHPTWDLHPQTLRLLRRNAVRQVRRTEAAATT